jgi:hypothetical protein
LLIVLLAGEADAGGGKPHARKGVVDRLWTGLSQRVDRLVERLNQMLPTTPGPEAGLRKGIVTEVEPPSIFVPGGSTRVRMVDQDGKLVGFWINSRTAVPLRRLLSREVVRKGDRIEVYIDQEGNAERVSLR